MARRNSQGIEPGCGARLETADPPTTVLPSRAYQLGPVKCRPNSAPAPSSSLASGAKHQRPGRIYRVKVVEQRRTMISRSRAGNPCGSNIAASVAMISSSQPVLASIQSTFKGSMPSNLLTSSGPNHQGCGLWQRNHRGHRMWVGRRKAKLSHLINEPARRQLDCLPATRSAFRTYSNSHWSPVSRQGDSNPGFRSRKSDAAGSVRARRGFWTGPGKPVLEIPGNVI